MYRRLNVQMYGARLVPGKPGVSVPSTTEGSWVILDTLFWPSLTCRSVGCRENLEEAALCKPP